jgi:hypothetical protein
MRHIVSPIELNGTEDHLDGHGASVSDEFLNELAQICEITTDLHATAEASRDWWPLALHWSLAGKVPRRATVVARPPQHCRGGGDLRARDHASGSGHTGRRT